MIMAYIYVAHFVVDILIGLYFKIMVEGRGQGGYRVVHTQTHTHTGGKGLRWFG